jgi:hypothetical protein
MQCGQLLYFCALFRIASSISGRQYILSKFSQPIKIKELTWKYNISKCFKFPEVEAGLNLYTCSVLCSTYTPTAFYHQCIINELGINSTISNRTYTPTAFYYQCIINELGINSTISNRTYTPTAFYHQCIINELSINSTISNRTYTPTAFYCQCIINELNINSTISNRT